MVEGIWTKDWSFESMSRLFAIDGKKKFVKLVNNIVQGFEQKYSKFKK